MIGNKISDCQSLLYLDRNSHSVCNFEISLLGMICPNFKVWVKPHWLEVTFFKNIWWHTSKMIIFSSILFCYINIFNTNTQHINRGSVMSVILLIVIKEALLNIRIGLIPKKVISNFVTYVHIRHQNNLASKGTLKWYMKR